jgi:hypothetical protein
MNRLRALLLCLIATLFVASGIARAAPPPTEPPPCHMTTADMSDMGSGHPTPKHGPVQHDMLAMNCCLGCLPSLVAPIAGPRQQPQRIVFDLRQSPMQGRSLVPELGPPRRG